MFIIRLIYILLCAEMLRLNIVYISYLPIVLIPIVFGLPLILLLIVFINKENLKVDFKAGRDIVQCKEKVIYGIQLTNNSIFPILGALSTVEIKNSVTGKKYTERIRIPVGARKSEIIYFEMEAEHCGVLTLELKSVKIYDFINLCTCRKTCGQKCTLTVLPKVSDVELVHNDTTSFAEDSTTYSKVKPGDDQSEIFDIRDYRGGDRVHRIHWKLSNKYNKLLVKEFSLPISDNQILLFEFDGSLKNEPDKADSLLEAFLSVAYAMTEKYGIIYKIGFFNKTTKDISVVRISDKDQLFNTVYNMMSEADTVSRDKGMAIRGYAAARKTDPGERILYFACSPDNEEMAMVKDLKSKSDISVIICDKQIEHYDADKLGISIYNIEENSLDLINGMIV